MATKGILIVDDEAIILLSLKQTLKLHFGSGYRYETAMNAAQGLSCIAQLVAEGVEIVLVISDWLMPGMKGDEFLSQVHALDPAIKLVMLTGHADDSEMARLAGKVKIEAFLRKPWNTDRLFEVVGTALT
jgi:DNA-binding NtrC family response regulator